MIALIAALAAGATWWRDRNDHAAEVLPPAHTPTMVTTASPAYEWSTLPIGAGGFVTGLVAATSDDAGNGWEARSVAALPQQTTPPPVWIGGNSAAALRRAPATSHRSKPFGSGSHAPERCAMRPGGPNP